jgi:DNA-binding response OmpR family regulator
MTTETLPEGQIYLDGWLFLNRDYHDVVVGQRVEHLTPTEWRLLMKFVDNPKRLLSIYELWESVPRGGKECVHWHVSRLLKKLTYEGDPFPIVNVRTFGYRYDPMGDAWQVQRSGNEQS